MQVFLSPERGVSPTKEIVEVIRTLLSSGIVSKCVIDPTGVGGPIADKMKQDGYRVVTAYPSVWKELM